MGSTTLDRNLLNAALKGDANAVDRLADKGANADARDTVERTGLWHAAADGNMTLILILMKHGANANLADRDGISPLTKALEGRHWAAAEQLLETADINARAGEKMFTALHSAIWLDMAEEKTARVKFLMEHWADAKVKDEGGSSPYETARELALKWPFAQKLVDLIEEYKDGPAARQAYLDRKRGEGITRAFQGTTRDIAAPEKASWKPRPARMSP